MGTAEKLNKVTMITIPGEALDISGAKETLTKDIDISTYPVSYTHLTQPEVR